mgnify:CR=1 FL=1
MEKLLEDLLSIPNNHIIEIQEISSGGGTPTVTSRQAEEETKIDYYNEEYFYQNPFRFCSTCNCKTCKELKQFNFN